jgi:myo-inositol catabolism protein IolC
MKQTYEEIEELRSDLVDFGEQVKAIKEAIRDFKALRAEAVSNRAWDDARAYGEGIDANYGELNALYATRDRQRELREQHNEAKEKSRVSLRQANGVIHEAAA